MVTNVNFPAPLQVLALLGTVFVIVICGATAMYGAITDRRWTKFALVTIAVVVGIYVVLLFSFSLVSPERLLSAGQDKYFCEIDCHLAYSVVSVQENVHEHRTGVTEKLWTVHMRTRFDENTISESRPKDAPLTPNPRSIILLDEDGAQYLPSISAQTEPPRFGEALRPGESYVSDLEFRVPVQLQRAKLLLIAAGGPERLLIGSESSPLHRRTYFTVIPDTPTH